MTIAAEFGTGQVLWSLLYFFAFAVWILLVFQTVTDIFRSDDLSGPGKAAWTLALVVLPFVGVFLYLIVRGQKMSRRQLATMRERDGAVEDYIRAAASAPTRAEQLAALADLHDEGKLTDDEYGAAKSGILDA